MSVEAAARRVRLVRLGLSEEYGSVQLVLGAIVVLGPIVFLATMILAGSGFTWWFLVLSPLAVLGAARPESPGHLVLWVLLLVVWVTAVPGPFTWWSVPAVAPLPSRRPTPPWSCWAADRRRATWRRTPGHGSGAGSESSR